MVFFCNAYRCMKKRELLLCSEDLVAQLYFYCGQILPYFATLYCILSLSLIL